MIDDRTEAQRHIDWHLDWWGKCRTCSFWTGDRDATTPGTCGNAKSDMHGQETWTEGHCRSWDTFDIVAAVAVLDGAR